MYGIVPRMRPGSVMRALVTVGTLSPASSGRGGLRDAEIQNLQPAVGRQEQILRLDVAVDDAAIVSRGETTRDLRAVTGDLLDRQRAAIQLRTQGLAREELADEVRHTVVRADVMDGRMFG